jgi:predicted 2-oxoglutarate/Fe(II)-dependent dioxygenase YbiX
MGGSVTTDIRVIPNAIEEPYCRHLIAEMSQHLTRAMFWTNGVRVFDARIRDAYNYKWHDTHLSGITAGIVRQFEGSAVVPERVEPMEIVCYPPGNGNERHLDGPHRSHSLVYFLNRGYEGGELVFDDGHTFRDMPVGSAVAWENGPETWHAGAPLTRGFKWVVVSWVRRPEALETETEVHARIKREKEAVEAPLRGEL